MCSRFHFAFKRQAARFGEPNFLRSSARVPRRFVSAALALAASSILLAPRSLHARPARADVAQPVGRIQGADISINGAAIGVNSSDAGLVSNGNVIAVHEGQARFKLTAGGEISICGPAKFTVLQSGDAITLALDFGRMHVDVPATVSLRIFTASIVATPLDIQGGQRDLTVGLDQKDSLCIVASTGAVQLEQQLSGQKMIIPENGDFSLNSGELVPVVGSASACQCVAAREIVPAPRPAPPQIAMSPAPVPAAAPVQSAVQPPAAEQPAPTETQSAPVYQVMLPPMSFSAAAPKDTNVPSAESALLIREVHVNPDWEFTGHVEPSEFARDLSRSLGVSGQTDAARASQSPAANGSSAATAPSTTATAVNTAPATPPPASKPHRGFWASLKSIF